MKIKKETHNLLHISNFPVYIGIIAGLCILIVLGKIVQLIITDRFQPTHTLFLLTILIFFFGGAAFTKKEDFIVNKNEKNIYWSRKGLFGSKEGIIPFDKIIDVFVQNTYGDAGQRYRVSIRTYDELIPVTEAYSAGKIDKFLDIQDKIIKMVLPPKV